MLSAPWGGRSLYEICFHDFFLPGNASDRDVCLCLETHDSWCDPAHLVRVVEEADHPAVRINWDLMHPVMTADKTMDEAFEVVRPWLAHVHFHDGYWEGEAKEKRVMTPVGQGVIDHRRALELLPAADYRGFLSGEWIRWRPHGEHLPQELNTLKTYDAELSLRQRGRVKTVFDGPSHFAIRPSTQLPK